MPGDLGCSDVGFPNEGAENELGASPTLMPTVSSTTQGYVAAEPDLDTAAAAWLAAWVIPLA
jgi:hypothetical protein